MSSNKRDQEDVGLQSEPAYRSDVRSVPASSQAIGAYSKGFEEDDNLRSDFVRLLTLQQLARDQQAPPTEPAVRAALIPKTLLQYWDDPMAVPSDVLGCLDSWNALREEGITIRMFGDASARVYIAERYGPREVAAFERCRHPAMRSDFFRMSYLLAEGGLYVDADDVLVGDGWREIFRDNRMKVQPFCYDINVGGMVSATEIRRADLPTEDRIFYVNNNPIAAPAGHPVLQRALGRAADRLLGDNPTPEIQSTTGPGNLTASLAAHALELQEKSTQPDFELLLDWDKTADTRWDLAYRSGSRNWRNMDGR